jgi:tRNA 2-thiouridine synthesizing protein A
MMAEQEWDAGDLGCGDLVLELRARVERLRPGEVFTLVARDPGAAADLPAWCRMTGHTLVSARPTLYGTNRAGIHRLPSNDAR